MATKITSRVIAPGAVTAAALAPGVGAGPVIANVQIANSSYVALDDTAVALGGGYILINGENFGQNTQVIIANTNATSVTYISSSLVRAQVPAKSAGSYIIYLVNTDTGATAIRVNAITYSGTPSWSTGSSLADGNVDEAVSIQLSATSDTSVTYQVQTGSTLPTGLTLAANGLLSGTVTGLNEDTLYNFTIEAVDAENQDSPRSFSITITVGDQYINSTVLALNADTNTFITDASTNNFQITPNGDTRPSAFSPYNTSWSNFFDGTGDFLSFPSNLRTAMGGGFAGNLSTMEAWIYPTASGTIFGRYDAIAENGRFFWSIESNNMRFGYTIGPGDLASVNSTGSLVTLNAWHHVAVTIDSTTPSSTTVRMFINGVLINTFTGQNFTSQTEFAPSSAPAIGTGGNATTSFTGNISNFRFVTGALVYTANFTPPTAPLTAISGTSLLTCQSNRLIDNSTNNFAITRNGDVRVTSFGPFTETDTTTGSGYFDGSGDRLSIADNAAFDIGLSNQPFTVEAWYYPTSATTNYQGIIGRGGGFAGWNSTNGWQYSFFLLSNLIYFQHWNGSNLVSFNGSLTSTSVANRWNHMAVSYNGNNLSIFVNGSRIATTTSSLSKPSSSSITRIGSSVVDSETETALGYLSNIRVIKGTAVYDPTQTTLTVPTSPLTAIANTSLLTLQNRISYNNSQPVDESGVKNIITRAGNASVGSYTPHTPAGWSAYFDGTGDYLSLPNNAALELGNTSGDFTVEAWIYLFSMPTGTSTTSWTSDWTNWFVIYERSAGGTNGWQFRVGQTLLTLGGNSDTSILWGTHGMVVRTWYHVVATRSGSTYRLFVNGTQIASGASATGLGSGGTFYIGSEDTSGAYFNGYISNLRVLKGTALYTSNFTPSTTPLEPIANTSLLILRGPRFTDDGPNRFAITRNGDTRITPFSPFKTHTIVPDSHSVYFDGSGDFLSTPGDNSLVLDGNFTIEFYMYLNSLSLGGVISSNDGSFLNDAFAVVVNQSQSPNKISFFERAVSSSFLLTSSTTLTVNRWYHIAFVRNSGVIKLFLDGIEEDDYTTNNTITLNGGSTPLFRIGQYWAGDLNGYISNLRIVKGSAVYTSNFTPSTSPLTNIANTSLLTCQSSTAIDNSNNAFAITVNGNAQPFKFNPFGETVTTGVQYSPASHGGSYYFDGTGDYLKTPTSSSFNWSGTSFTITGWFYSTNQTSPQHIFASQVDGSNRESLYFSANTTLTWWVNGSARINATGIIPQQWNHFAVVNLSGTTTLYINGENRGTWSSTYTSGNRVCWVGTYNDAASAGDSFIGYISGMRVLTGTALYTSAFVPPAAPPSPVAGTTLLLNGTNAAIADGVGKNVLETVGNARIINDIKKYGTGSMYFDGTGDYLLALSTPNYDFGTGNFTIEMWINIPNVNATWNTIISRAYGIAGGWRLYKNNSNNQLRWYHNLTSIVLTTGSTLQNNTWSHIAVVRNNGTLSIYIDGVSRGSASDSNNYNPGNYAVEIGSGVVTSAFPYTGYIDDLRITKGVARYTANFTPPTSSFKLK